MLPEIADTRNKMKTVFEAIVEPDPKRKGVFHASRVRFFAFVIISLCLFAASGQCILAVWNYVGQDAAWRSLSTLGIVSVTVVIFTILNEAFASMMAD